MYENELQSIITVSKELGAIEGAYEIDEYGREIVVSQAIDIILRETEKYNFKVEYDEEEWDKIDNTYDDIELSNEDFYNTNITGANYPKASLVIDDIATDFILYLKKRISKK